MTIKSLGRIPTNCVTVSTPTIGDVTPCLPAKTIISSPFLHKSSSTSKSKRGTHFTCRCCTTKSWCTKSGKKCVQRLQVQRKVFASATGSSRCLTVAVSGGERMWKLGYVWHAVSKK